MKKAVLSQDNKAAAFFFFFSKVSGKIFFSETMINTDSSCSCYSSLIDSNESPFVL